ncbi:hypothetical protein FOXYSP1_20867 [Fusarium oxysporum f. sp. phaseoli]
MYAPEMKDDSGNGTVHTSTNVMQEIIPALTGNFREPSSQKIRLCACGYRLA